jgi:hypothetical protein
VIALPSVVADQNRTGGRSGGFAMTENQGIALRQGWMADKDFFV